MSYYLIISVYWNNISFTEINILTTSNKPARLTDRDNVQSTTNTIKITILKIRFNDLQKLNENNNKSLLTLTHVFVVKKIK